MADTMTETAKLIIDGKEYEFPVIEGTEGERGIDISKLRAQTGYITMDPGYANTGSCQSSITFIDGEKGILRYRGYPIDQLAEPSPFLETSYLVLNGELPSKDELAKFENEITYHTLLHEDMRHMYQAFPLRAHPMAVVSAVVGSLATFYQEEIDPLNGEHVDLQVRRLIAKLPTICAWAYKYSIGHPFVYPRNDLELRRQSPAHDVRHAGEDYEVDPASSGRSTCCSSCTPTTSRTARPRPCASWAARTANLFASASAAIGALWGPLHGGANQAVIEMLEVIHGAGLTGKQYLEQGEGRPGHAG